MKNKKNLQIKAYRKDIAELLRNGKQDYARIRVEAVLRENAALQALEILALYLELVAMRATLIQSTQEVPRDMVEAISSCLYAAQRVPDLPELETLLKMFAAKYGKEYVQQAASDASCSKWMVNENLRRCLTIEPPEPALKLEALSDIAQEFGVEWDMDRARRELLPPDLGPYGTVGSTYAPPAAQPGMRVPGAAAAAPMPPARATPPAPAPVPATFIPPAMPAVPVGLSRHPGQGPGLQPTYSSDSRYGPPGAGPAAPPQPGSPAAPLPPQGWLLGRPPVVAAAQPVGTGLTGGAAAAAAGAGSSQAPLPTVGSNGVPAGLDSVGSSQQFTPKSVEDVQRTYDAAQGPPSKPGASKPAGSAPASTSVAGPSAPAADDLPAVPAATSSPAATRSSGDDAFDELQKRFEALKRG